MKKFILYRLLLVFVMAVFIGTVVTSDLKDSAQNEVIMMATLFGSLAITSESGVPGLVVFDTVLEDWVGGANINRARLPAITIVTQVLEGALLYIAAGAAEVIKTVTVIDGGTATAVWINKTHLFNVGDVVMIAVNGNATAITDIDYSNAGYDIITIATLGVTPLVDEVLVEATAITAGSDAVAKYTANAILKNTTNVERANPSGSGVVRGSVRSAALPYGAFSSDITALSNLIRFVA